MPSANQSHSLPVLVECPRDAMQGWHNIIPTNQKVRYLNSLLEVGFDTLDFGSFVSHKVIPQMADTKEVLSKLNTGISNTKLLAIVANTRGAEEAVLFDEINYLGFPFSLSPEFQRRNTNSSMEESIDRIDAIQELCVKHGKELVVYLSMGFGNPYGDPYNENILLHWAEEMVKKDIGIISLADTVGVAEPLHIRFAFETLIPQFPETVFGAHLHATPDNRENKLKAAWDAGCRRFDGALKGIGGCPMAQDELVGNMDTEAVISLCKEKGAGLTLDTDALRDSIAIANEIFQ